MAGKVCKAELIASRLPKRSVRRSFGHNGSTFPLYVFLSPPSLRLLLGEIGAAGKSWSSARHGGQLRYQGTSTCACMVRTHRWKETTAIRKGSVKMIGNGGITGSILHETL